MADFIESLVRARFLVASLGEITSPPWWRSQATTPVGLRALERLFPRTYLAPSCWPRNRESRSGGGT